MLALRIILDGDGAFPDLLEKRAQGKLLTGTDLAISALSAGMTSGRPSVAIRVDCADGSVVFVETSLRLLLTAADAFKARYGDPRQGRP